jgi:hypothetical protein
MPAIGWSSAPPAVRPHRGDAGPSPHTTFSPRQDKQEEAHGRSVWLGKAATYNEKKRDSGSVCWSRKAAPAGRRRRPTVRVGREDGGVGVDRVAFVEEGDIVHHRGGSWRRFASSTSWRAVEPDLDLERVRVCPVRKWNL